MSLKVKLISCISLFMLMIGVLIIGVFAATQQQLTMKGSVSFVVPDKSLYVKEVRIKQDMVSEPESISSFMPGYINGEFNLDLTGITDVNNYGSFTLYFDIINTTESYWQIADVDLGDLTNDGVSEEHGGIVRVNELIDTDDDGYKNFDPSTPIDGTLTLTIIAPNVDADNPIVLDGIVITIDEAQPNITAISSNETLGQAQGAFAEYGDEVTISADFVGVDADFLGWRAGSVDGELVSTLLDYNFTFTEKSPTTYYAIFETANSNLTYRYTTSSGTASVSGCVTSATEVTISSAIYRTSRLPYEFSVTSIGDGAFNGCTSLTNITIPSSVTSIGNSAFWGCSSLASITIPEGVTSIGDYAFSSCSSLESIEIPDSVTSIGSGAFSSCSELEAIIVEEGNTVYHSDGNCLIETASGTLIVGCKNSVMPTDGSVTSIGESAFSGCSGLTSIAIPNSVTSIGNSAFYGCSSLTSIEIPDSVTSIGGQAFDGCSGLETVTINVYIYTSVESQSSCGCILQIAATVYVPQVVVETAVITSYLSSNFTQGELVDGYYVFTRNA